ncbi:reverse transcriptase [Phytophthora megakarya]|uniref:Reverse transcriptase n=1 Tax=Phytophthora megakarya TaxID=4795 RepID=A0A225VGF4_9STRA|nr:reverse transcriptase [Phytophthora megakarya]
MQGEMHCKAPGLQLLRQKALNRLRSWPKHEFLHVKLEWNQSANKLASAALQREEGEIVPSEDGRQDLITLNRLGDMLKPKLIETVVSVNAITRAAERQRHILKAMEESIIQRIRYQRIRQGQDEEKWIADLKKYLDGEVSALTAEEAKTCSKIAANYEVDENGLLFFCPKGEAPGNIQGTYPFQVISMDHIPSLPKSFKGNTELLIWADLFTGYEIAKAGPSREAQAMAENYEECVFRRFGASESATIAYRPQGNGKAERTVQTLTRALKMYVADVNQQDWDDYAERLMFALNTVHDRVRGETSFFLVHGWDPRAREAVNENIRDAIKSRADQHNENVRPHRIEEDTQVWLYLDRVKEGYARKLAHMWHGPFRVTELIGNHAARLETAGSGYRISPIVHLSKLKLVRTFPDRPKSVLNTEDDDRVDFDEELLPDDSWDTRYGRVHREFQVYWKGYDQPTWVNEADLNCAALLYEYERGRTTRNRFYVMQSHEEGMNAE